MKNEVTTQNVKVELSETQSIMAMIAKAQDDPLFDIAKMERLFDLYERAQKRQAEIEFNESLSRISQKMPRITRSSTVAYDVDKNDKTKGKVDAFKFASYENIDKVIRPLLVEEGFSLSYTTEPRVGDGGGLMMTGTLSHRSGHSRSASISLALDASGGKNNIQAMGSSSSYGKRYTMCMLLNIVTVGEDDDGNGATFITTEQVLEIESQLEEIDADLAKFLEFMNVETIGDILLKDLPKATNMIAAKKRRKPNK